MSSKRIRAVRAAFVALVAVALFVPTVSTQGTSPGAAYADLVQVGGSGIEGQLRFIDNGISLRTFSSAPVSGFNPLKTYVTLVYGLNSRGPGEASPICGRDTTLGFDEMFIGAWLLPGVTSRTLDSTKVHTIFIQLLGTPLAQPAPGGVRLDEVRTVSIREFNPPPGNNPSTDPTTLVAFLIAWATGDIPPSVFQLRACGFIYPGNPLS
jgi:hypothetical protein